MQIAIVIPKVAAQDTINYPVSIARNSVYLELGGNGLWYSVNYDKIFSLKEKVGFSGRIGFSYLQSQDTISIIIPVTASYLFGKKNNFFELGGGPLFFRDFKVDISLLRF